MTKAQLVALAQKAKLLLAANQQLKAERDALKLAKEESMSLVLHTPPTQKEEDKVVQNGKGADLELEIAHVRHQLACLKEQESFLRVQLQHQDEQITQKSLELATCEKRRVASETQLVDLHSSLSSKAAKISELERDAGAQAEKFRLLAVAHELLQNEVRDKHQIREEGSMPPHDLELQLKEKNDQLLALNEASTLQQEELNTYRLHVDELTQTVTGLRASVAEAAAKELQSAALQQVPSPNKKRTKEERKSKQTARNKETDSGCRER